MRLHLTIREHRDGLPPCQSITVGKLDFRRYTSVPSKREGLPDQVYLGAVGEYSEADVEAFRERVKHLVVRWGYRVKKDGTRQLWSAQVHDTRVAGFFPVPEADEPLERYLEVQPIGAGVPVSTIFGSAPPEHLEAVAAASASEERARREDPTDQSRRARHGRAKAAGEGVEG